MSEEQLQTETMADYEEHFDDANPWNRVTEYMEQGTVLPVKVEGIVNGGAIAMVEGLRGFIPASKLSLSYIEDLEDYLLKDIEVQVIDVDQANNRLVLSARELLKEKERKEKEKLLASVEVGSVLTGTVETLQTYGAFIRLENGLSGLVHVSQICEKRIKTPADVLKTGEEVNVKVIGHQRWKDQLEHQSSYRAGRRSRRRSRDSKIRRDRHKSRRLIQKYSTIVKNTATVVSFPYNCGNFYTVASLS